MNDQGREWRERMLPLVQGLSDELAHRYSPQGEIAHFVGLAETIDRVVDIPALSAAGFLHGVDPGMLGDLTCDIPKPAIQILTAVHGFRLFDIRDALLPQRLSTQIPPTPHGLTAAYLLVLDHLHHFDPDAEVAGWWRLFYTDPHAGFESLPRAPRFLEAHEKPTVRIAFVEKVVAPMAFSLGLWHERNVLSNAALLFRDPERFSTMVEFVRRFSSPGSAISAWTEMIHGALGDLPGVQFRWEWQNLADMSSRIPAGTEVQASWESHVRRCGAVVVVCEREATGHEALGRLHARFPYASAGARGAVFGPTPTGYQALHTNVFLGQGRRAASAGSDAPILVRIMTHSVEEQRFNSLARPIINARDFVPQKAEITVLAPSGDEIRLPVGARVLNFAAKIHGEFVVLAKGARVNRETVDLLHELQDGDVVWLELGVSPRLLPEGWENHVPQSTHTEILQNFKKYYRAALGNSGERWLRNELAQRGMPGDLAADDLHELLKMALRSERLQQLPLQKDHSGWLEQIGILEARIRGEAIPHKLVIDESQRDALVEEVIRLTVAHSSHHFGSGTPGPQHIVIEGADRAGLVADVASVFSERGLGMTEFVAVQLNPGRGILRVRTDPTESSRLEDLLDALRRIGSVRFVHPPGSEPTADERHFLPQRHHSSLGRGTLPSPYIRGEPVPDDAHFYGMTTQLGKLQEQFDSLNGLPLGTLPKQAFVSGPKKVGKTSLVLAFLRSVIASQRCVAVHLEAVMNETWSRYTERLAARVHRHATEIQGGSLAGLLAPGDQVASFGRFIGQVQQTLECPVVVAVDEVVQLFHASVRAGEEQPIFDFAATIQDIPGLMVIWVGPEAPLRHLPDSIQHLLRSVRQVPMRPFSRAVMKEFLSAQKLSSKYKIYVEQNLIDRIFDLTSGNPYWAASVADEMWSLFNDEKRQYFHYDEAGLDRAAKRVARYRVAFADRYGSDVWDARQKKFAWSVLLSLARSATQPRTTQELVSDAVARGVGIEGASTVALIEELEERGAVTELPAGWQIAAPLFAEHILGVELRLNTEKGEDA